MPAIHHATAKRAAKVGIELTDEGNRIVARETEDGLLLAVGEDAKLVLEAAERQRLSDNEPDQDEPEDDNEEVESDDNEEDEPKVERSIVKRKYRQLYAPKNRSCGDELAQLVTAHVKDEENEIVDLDKLRRFAQLNGCWVDDYKNLNPGQQRMNVGNRLRAKVRKGHEVIWG